MFFVCTKLVIFIKKNFFKTFLELATDRFLEFKCLVSPPSPSWQNTCVHQKDVLFRFFLESHLILRKPQSEAFSVLRVIQGEVFFFFFSLAQRKSFDFLQIHLFVFLFCFVLHPIRVENNDIHHSCVQRIWHLLFLCCSLIKTKTKTAKCHLFFPRCFVPLYILDAEWNALTERNPAARAVSVHDDVGRELGVDVLVGAANRKWIKSRD